MLRDQMFKLSGLAGQGGTILLTAAVFKGSSVFCGKVANELFVRSNECPSACAVRFCRRRITVLLRHQIREWLGGGVGR